MIAQITLIRMIIGFALGFSIVMAFKNKTPHNDPIQGAVIGNSMENGETFEEELDRLSEEDLDSIKLKEVK